jgi:hypothetical protein
VHEIQEERDRIMAAQRSLEIEKALIRIKKESYKNELDQCLMMKKHKEGY